MVTVTFPVGAVFALGACAGIIVTFIGLVIVAVAMNKKSNNK